MESLKNVLFEKFHSFRNKPAELAKKTEGWFLEHKYIKTKNFGWIKESDYLDPRFTFLSKDKGVPYIEKEIITEKVTITADAYGKEKKKTKIDKEKVMSPSEEWIDWLAQKKQRERERYMADIEERSFDELIKEI